jgi:hypothetical protein
MLDPGSFVQVFPLVLSVKTQETGEIHLKIFSLTACRARYLERLEVGGLLRSHSVSKR